jgi:hypothetical protein
MARQERDLRLTVLPEPFDFPFVLSVSKDERLPQDRLVEG